MWQQITTIAWAQFRTMRNHLPRTNVGAVLLWLLMLGWYGLYVMIAVFLIVDVPTLSLFDLREWTPVALLGIFTFWQLLPLFTLSSGWSLQLNKLQMYPISDNTLFGMEVLLRFTTAPEMIVVLLGGFVGLLRHPAIPFWAPWFIFLFVPFNLFLSLGIRESILHSFERNRFRELFAVIAISIGIIPQFLLRTGLGRRLSPYFFAAARGTAMPWHEISALSLGLFSFVTLGMMLLWTGAACWFARRQFSKALTQDHGFRAGPTFTTAEKSGASPSSRAWSGLTGNLFRDPLAALLQKELQSLLRMPRFRVIFGMAAIFSVVVFVPIALRTSSHERDSFVANNFLPVATLYGILLLSDVLLLNIFGFDRAAAQIYFVAPVPFATVLKAKNLVAIVFIILQSAGVMLLAVFFRGFVTPFNVANAVAAAAVVGLFFLSVGNISSIAMARPLDPTQTFRKQTGGKMQFWFLLASIGMFLLVGFAFLARWAVQSDWALLGVLLVEFLVGLIVYRVATQSAIERGLRDREQLIEALSRGTSPVGLGSG